jgi:hypothetical protein
LMGSIFKLSIEQDNRIIIKERNRENISFFIAGYFLGLQ